MMGGPTGTGVDLEARMYSIALLIPGYGTKLTIMSREDIEIETPAPIALIGPVTGVRTTHIDLAEGIALGIDAREKQSKIIGQGVATGFPGGTTRAIVIVIDGEETSLLILGGKAGVRTAGRETIRSLLTRYVASLTIIYILIIYLGLFLVTQETSAFDPNGRGEEGRPIGEARSLEAKASCRERP